MEKINRSGVTYYKLTNIYPGDTTKNCGLTGIEIDANFNVLRGKDVKDIFIDQENGHLVIELLNGEKLVVEDFFDYISETKSVISSVIYDDGNGILTIVTNEGEYITSGFTVKDDIKIMTDNETIFGDGTEFNPVRLNVSYKTGIYSPAELSDNKEDFRPGNRYLFREQIDYCNNGILEWAYFIYEWDSLGNEWVKKELLPNERIILKNYIGVDYAEVICRSSDNGSVLEIYKKIIETRGAIKLSESPTKKTIWLKIKDGENILSQNEDGIYTTLSIDYYHEEGEEPLIRIKGINDKVISYIEVGDFLTDKYIDRIYLSGNSIYFNLVEETANSKTEQLIPVPLDTLSNYKEGSGITITNNHVIQIKIHSSSEPYLTVNKNGLRLSGVTNAINTKVNELSGVVKNIISDLSAETESAISDLSANTENAISELSAGTESAISDLSANTENAISDLSAETESAISDLSANTENAISDLSANTENAISDASEELLSKIKEISGYTLSGMSEVLAVIAELSAETEENFEQVNSAITILSSTIQEISGHTLSGMSEVLEVISEFSAGTVNKFKEIDESLLSIDETLKEISGSTISGVSELSELLYELSSSTINGFSDVENSISELNSSFNETVAEIYSAITENKLETDEEIAELSNELNEKLNQIENEVSEVKNELGIKFSAITNEISSITVEFLELIEEEADAREKDIENVMGYVNSALTEVAEDINDITGSIEEIWEELNKKDSGIISRDIVFSGRNGELITIESGTTVTDALEIVAENAGGGGDGKVKDVEVNDNSILDEETGIASLNVRGKDNDIDVNFKNGELIIGIKGISNEQPIIL